MADEPIRTVIPLLKNVKPRGDSGRMFTSLCPAHEDRANSFAIECRADRSVNLHCYAGCAKDAVLRALGLEMKDLFPGKRERKVPKNAGVTLAQLEFHKRIPVPFLKEHGLRDHRDGSKSVVVIPYRDADGTLLYERQREGPTGSENMQPKGAALRLFGLHRLNEFRAAGRLILVEGETDTLTLWLHGYPALGIPGASAVGSFDATLLDGFTDLLVWQEPDGAGSSLIRNLREKFGARPWKVICSDVAKDPNDLHRADPEKFVERFEAIIAGASLPPEPLPIPTEPVPAPSLVLDVSGSGVSRTTDLANARLMAKWHGHDLKFSHTQNCWFIWNGIRWEPDETGEVNRRAMRTIDDVYPMARAIPSAEARAKMFEHAAKSHSARALSAMVKLSENLPGIPARIEDLDADPWLFNCPNGTIDLRTGTLRPHDRADQITQLSPVSYDPAATCPLFESFLGKVFPADIHDPAKGGNAGLIGYTQRLIGYGLTADVREHTLPIFWGAGSNGKSTLIETVAMMFGRDYWAAAPEGMLMVRRNEAHPTELARLYRKRLVAATETEEGARLNASLVKRLTGGDTITARFMRKDFFEFLPSHKLLVSTNDRPQILNGGHGMWRRVALIPFLVRFWKPELGEIGPEHLRADKLLPEKLKAELPGILAWSVRGCLEWQRIGLNPPDEIKVATSQYREQQNTIGAFLLEKCETTNAAGVELSLRELYAVYCRYAEENGDRPFGKIRFNEAVQKENVTRVKNKANVDVWVGLKLRQTAAQAVASMADLDE